MATQTENELIDQIACAFAGVRLGDGMSLNESECADSWGYDRKAADLAQFDEREDWSRIPNETIERFTAIFSFADIEGIRFHMPAYMIWTIRNYQSSCSNASNETIYGIDPEHYRFKEVPFLQAFTEAQVSAMASFLEFCSAREDYFDAPVAQKNLDKIKALPNQSVHGTR